MKVKSSACVLKDFRGFCAVLTAWALAFFGLSTAYAQPKVFVKVPAAPLSFMQPAGYQRLQNPAPALYSCAGKVTGDYALRIAIRKTPASPGQENLSAALRQLVIYSKEANPKTYKQVATGQMRIGGRPAAFLTSTFTTTWKTKIEVKQIVVVKDKQVYRFSFGAAYSVYPKEVRAFDKMIASVKWQ